jgi:agmatine deiminase
MPAEWEPHAATWVAWPHSAETWPGCLAEAQAEFEKLVAELAQSEDVQVLVQDASLHEHVERLAARLPAGDRIHLHELPTDDVWMRDIGPTFVRGDPGGLIAIDWTFDAWGGKYPPWERDDAVASRIATLSGVSRIRPGLVLEGGAIDVDGEGSLLATESTLLDPKRNPGLGRAELEGRLHDLLGVKHVLWLGEGIAGDDTDGHVDDIARFVGPGVVVHANEPDPGDANHAPLADLAARLHEKRNAASRPLRLVELPMPEPLYAEGERLPASYANFYIANDAVLVPVFGSCRDQSALEILQPLFPGRAVVPIPSRHLVRGLGSIHCLTQQEPARRRT